MTSAVEIQNVIEKIKNRIQQFKIYANYLRSEGRANELMYTTEQVVDILEDILREVEND